MIKTLRLCLIAFFSFFCLIPNVISQNNWQLLNPAPTPNLGKEIKFVSESTGYIINKNEILETIDSGVTWKKKQNINSGNDLKFFNNIGYIVGNSGYILKSIDSGTSWTQVNAGFVSNFNSVTIVNETTVVISSSNTIIKSLDGGNTWLSLNVPNAIVNKSFFTTPLIGHAACKNGKMLKTIDGGVNWYATMTSNVIPSDFFTIYFINENIGFASRQHSELYKTIDGGETWTEIPNISDSLFAFSFLNENIGYASGENGVILKTINGGLTWNSAGFQVGRVLYTDIYGIHFLDNNRGFATGASGRIIKTIDGGKTWTGNSPTYNNIKKIQFKTNEIGFALAGNSFFKTTDSGASWNIIGSVDDYKYSLMKSFYFFNENLGYASSESGHVLKTIDGGVTWNALNNGFALLSEGINSISVLNENTVVISGGYNTPKTLKTVDGGNTWINISNYNFSKMQFLDEMVGYAHDSYKRFYKTIDGGITWQLMFTAQEYINSIDFVDKDNGYLIGYNGLILKTNNGGVDWIRLKCPYENYSSVKFYSKNVGYVFSEYDLLYKTENGGSSWINIFNLPSALPSNSISISGKDIYLAGEGGQILKSSIDFKSFTMQLNPAQNILSQSAVLSGNVTVNEGVLDKVEIEYFKSGSKLNTATLSNSINTNSSLVFSFSLINLDPNSTYYYRIVATRDNQLYLSELKSFTTSEDYLIKLNTISNISSTKAIINGSITSNQYDIDGIEFQYSTEENFSKYSILKSNIIIKGNTTEDINGILTDLKPKTRYYVRLRAKYEGKEVYSEINSFVTQSEYEINLYFPDIVDNDVSLSAYIISKSNTISNIVYEYGILNYDNSIAINEQFLAGSAKFVKVQLTNLDPDKVYFYRIKALNGSNVIYSMSAIFNTSKQPLFKVGDVFENDNSIKLTGYLNTTGGSAITDIDFEYGLTPDFGSTISSNISDTYGNGTFSLNAVLNNPLKGVTYYYRLKGLDQNNNPLYSDISSFTTKSLGINTPDFNKSISLYPNPTNGLINFIVPENKNVNSILVNDELGRIINYGNSVKTGDLQNIDLSGKSTGVYYIKIIMDDNSIINKKVILK
ncbi:YCF48-related protein [Flavobacterium piscisymbiosum]|uniref:YCF48-related protein n=1 Tax=Flavobacterium piscisymbiosum TaxID=2893753 RepID=A0ABS8MG53_9FLAO|nr:YCF48-related protein [Flavobacterium sp. F-30]MCC9064467.1 YCF48-related protein [Flavobacterium sp. F-30]